MSDPFVEDGLEFADDVSSVFIDDIYKARCIDLGITPSLDASRRFALIVRRKVDGSCFDLAQNGIGPASAAVIARWLANDDLFTSLNLARNAIGNQGAIDIAQMIRVNPHLTAIDLRSNDITATGIAELADALQVNSAVAVLDLSSDLGFRKNTIGERGAQRLAAALAAPGSRVTELRLANVGTSGLACLAQSGWCKSSSLQVLDLRLNHIGDEAIGAIISPIVQHGTLNHVNLARNQLSDAASPALIALLSSSRLKLVDLSYNLLGKPFAMAIRDAYESGGCPSLEVLLLDGNQRIGTQRGHIALVDGLKLSNTITILSLSKCTIKDANSFASLIHSSKTLQRLSLSSNAIDDDDAVALCAGFAANASLLHLDLNDNGLGDKSGIALANSLRTNSTLQELHLKDNELTDVSVSAMLAAIRECGRSALCRLSLQLNRISMRLWHELDAALRSNKSNARHGQILAYSEHASTLQDRERDLRADIGALTEELQQRSPEAAQQELELAACSLESFKDSEVQETEQLRQRVESESTLVREQIREARAEHETLQSESRKSMRSFTNASHKLDMKIGIEQRKKNSTFLSLRKLQKEVREQSDIVREQNQLHDSLMRQLKDELDASRWLKDAAEKWVGKISRLTGQITNDYAEGMRTYLETCVPSPTKTNKIKQRWQRIKERRYLLLMQFQPDLFLKWFLDPDRPTPSRYSNLEVSSNDVNTGYSLHVKVASSPSMIDGSHAKLIHGSHSVYSMSLHGMGQVSTILVGLHDPNLAIEFRTLRADVAHVIIRAAGHIKMEEFRAIVAEKIGVDESDISALYHAITAEGKGRAARRRSQLHRSDAGPVGVADDNIDSQGVSSDEEKDFQTRGSVENPSSGKVKTSRRQQCRLQRRRTTPVRTSFSEVSEGDKIIGSALKEMQEMFPDPPDSAGEHLSSESDSGEFVRADKKISAPPHHTCLRPLQRSRSLNTATSVSASVENAAVSSRRNSEASPSVSQPRRTSSAIRQCKELMPWSYQHEHRRRNPTNLSESSSLVPETDLRFQLASTESSLGPMHPAVSTTLIFIGTYYADRGMHTEAEAAYTRALYIREKAFGRRHPHVATILHHMALLYSTQPERLQQAEPLLIRAVTVREKALGPRSPFVADSLSVLGRIYERLGQKEKAEPLFLRALTIRERIYGKRHAAVQETLQDLSRVNNGSLRSRVFRASFFEPAHREQLPLQLYNNF